MKRVEPTKQRNKKFAGCRLRSISRILGELPGCPWPKKLRLGADLYDDGICWLRQIIKAEQPTLSDDQVDQELDRRKAIKRRVEETGLIRSYEEDVLSGEV